jgi:UDP-glucose 4-epimerase
VEWLVTGGAGYIGAHVVHALRASGLGAIVLDDLSTGDPTRLPGDVPLLRADVRDPGTLRRALAQYRPVGVIHLAAHKDVADSVANPLRYYRDNLDGLRVLLQGSIAYDIPHVLFSSSAAVYGTPAAGPVTENAATDPDNPYGRSKLIGEWMLRDSAASAGFTWAAMRYFNVAGAGGAELRDRGATNLVPRLLRAAERREPARIFGGDYPTPDGTAVRDYIHVVDIADAHVRTALALAQGELADEVLNIGRGVGVSVREMVDAVGRALDNPLPSVVDPRRPGDPAEVVASADKIRTLLGWQARHDLDDIVRSAVDSPVPAPEPVAVPA